MSPTSPFLLLVLGFLALLVVDLLIALVEGVFLTWLSYQPFRQSMSISFIMNIISGIVNGVLLVFLQRSPYLWLPISFVLAVIIESFVMTYFKRHDLHRNSLRAIFVNLASYVILILPAYYFGSRA
jgi:hypothetical protein